VAYREEEEALRARVAKLEDELAEAKAATPAGLRAELDAQRASPVRREIALILDRAMHLRAEARNVIKDAEKLLGGPLARAPRWRASKRVLVGLVLAVVVLVAVGFRMTSAPARNGGRVLCKEQLDAFMLERLTGRDCDPLLLVDARALPEGPHAVRPTALVEVTRSAYGAPGMRLRGIDVPRVPPNGRVDLRTPAYYGVVSVHLETRGGVFDFEGMHHGFSADGDLVPDPRCTAEDVWRAAISAGVPAGPGALASLTYKSLPAKGRAGWVFESGGKKLLVDDATCGLFEN
jgi:hypothetical protein